MSSVTLFLGDHSKEEFGDAEVRKAAVQEGMDILAAEGIKPMNFNEFACTITIICQQEIIDRLRQLFVETGKGKIEIWGPNHPPFIGAGD